MALCLVFGDLKFGAIDDYFMAAVLTGAHGTDYNPHLLFVNALYGYALLPLYKLFPTIGWYYIGEIFSVFLSFTTISYIIIKKMGKQWGTLIATVFVALFASDFYLVVQFTQCASLLSATGMLVFANAVYEGRRAPGDCHPGPRAGISLYLPFIYALFLLLWGSIMRWQAFLMGMPFFCIGLLFLIKQCWARKIPVIISLAVMFIAAFGLQHWDRSLYDTPEYKPYMEIQGPRATLGDGSNFNDNAIYEDLEELGKSGKDYHLLKNWTFYDTETFQKDSMQAIVNAASYYKAKNERRTIPALLLSSLSHSLQMPMFWTWFISCLIILVTNRSKFPYLWATLGTTFFLMTILLAQDRLVYRVESGFWLYSAMLAEPLWNQIKNEKLNQIFNSRTIYATLGIIALANIVSYASSGDMVRDPSSGKTRTLTIEDSTDYKQVFDYIDSNQNKMFLLSMNAYMRFSHHKMPPYKAEPIGSYRNTISFGYWTPYLPEITRTLAEYGITNPMRQVIDSNVIVINEPMLGDFLLRHYYGSDSLGNETKDTIIVDSLRSFGEINFYKYRLVHK
ncbi:MAG: hypothetical protein MJZ25_01530 [Fibrobacter sp.]|nr:hypothetical protein [Fibrobacter sp.]